MTGQEIRNQIQESLSKQLTLLTEASAKCKTENLVKVTEAMVLLARELRNY